MSLLLLLACPAQVPDFVTISGTVSPNQGSAEGLAGVTVSIMDHTFEEVDSAVSDEEGFFSVQATAGVPVYFDLTAEGYARTGHSGQAGLVDWTVEPGQLWLESDDDLGELEALYAGCPGVGEGGGVIAGEVRYFVQGYEPEEGEWPIATTAYATAYSTEGDSTSSCHLNAAGSAYDPDAVFTGDSGQYAIFGGPSGPVTMTLGYEIEDQPILAAEYRIYVPDGGIAPLWPSYVPFPG